LSPRGLFAGARGGRAGWRAAGGGGGGGAPRLSRIAPLEEEIGLTGVFEVVEEVHAAGVRA